MNESTSGQPESPDEGDEEKVYPIHRVALRGLLGLVVAGGFAALLVVHIGTALDYRPGTWLFFAPAPH
ncbi:MAG: hypothetical protein JKY65_16800 [Planctomycetes bacterium]|nr:hypothetical protein [Planctomycetota bacterium]